MTIHALRIFSYGKFKNKVITFKDGFNYIYGENEAGKSTVMAFIKAMLYGFSGRGDEGDRKRYMPWDGGKLSGEMEATLSDGRRIIIQRTSGRTLAQDVCKVLDAVTGEEYNIAMDAEIGISENGFLKSAYIKQNSIALSGGDETLTDKLINLSTSGSEDIGYEDAMKVLTDRMRTLRHLRGGGGKIAELKKEITMLSDVLAKEEAEAKTYAGYVAEGKELEAEIIKLAKERTELENNLYAANASVAFRAARDANAKYTAHIEMQKETERKLAEIEKQRVGLAVFDEKISEDAYLPQEDTGAHKAKIIKAEKQVRFSVISLFVMFVALVASLFAGVYIVSTLAVALFFLSGVLIFHNKKKISTARNVVAEIEKRDEKRKAALLHFGCANLKEYNEKKTEKAALDEKVAGLNERLKLQKNIAEELFSEAEKLRNAADTFSSVSVTVQSPEEISEKAKTIRLIEEEKKQRLAKVEGILKGRQDGRKSPDLILSERRCLEEELAEAEEEYQALALAAETMEAVYGELSRDFTPRVNEKASMYLSRLTGKTEKLLLDKKYEITMGREEHKPLKLFSGGTIDQAFFAVRLAIAELILFDSGVPMFLDDAFMEYDAKREENAFSLLSDVAKERQVIFFSCRKREIEGINLIEL